MKKKEQRTKFCTVCGLPLELVEIDRGEKIAWYSCPVYAQGRAEDAEGHSAFSAPLSDEVEEEEVERQR